MRDWPTEIDFTLDNFAVSDGHYFRIAEPLAGSVLPFVGDEYVLSLAHEVYELKVGNRLAVFPAPIEVGLTVEAIVQRTGEMKIIAEDRFYRSAIFVDISLIALSGD